MTAAMLRAHFPQWPPTLNIIYMQSELWTGALIKWYYGCYEQDTFSCVIINTINMLNYLCYSHECSNGNDVPNHQSPMCKFTAKCVMAANSEVIQHLPWNMDDDLPPCETTACFSLFPRLFLDVLWLRASVIMPRSWLLDGFSTIRPHYSSLGPQLLVSSPLITRSRTHSYTYNLCSGWTDGQSHMHTHTNTNTAAALPSNTPPYRAKWQIAVSECS